MKDDIEDANGIESTPSDFPQVPMRKPRSKSVSFMGMQLFKIMLDLRSWLEQRNGLECGKGKLG